LKKVVLVFGIILLTLFTLPSLLFAEFTGKVVEVKNAKTLSIQPRDGGFPVVCKLYGIDTPERYQPYEEDSLNALKSLVEDQFVQVKINGKKTYKLKYCIVYKDGNDIGLEMINQGYAWAYRKILKPPYKARYIRAELQARSYSAGLWADPTPVAPWEWRKNTKQRRNK